MFKTLPYNRLIHQNFQTNIKKRNIRRAEKIGCAVNKKSDGCNKASAYRKSVFTHCIQFQRTLSSWKASQRL